MFDIKIIGCDDGKFERMTADYLSNGINGYFFRRPEDISRTIAYNAGDFYRGEQDAVLVLMHGLGITIIFGDLERMREEAERHFGYGLSVERLREDK